MKLSTDTSPNTARQFAAVARLGEDAQCTADCIVTRARAARRLGATAEAYRRSALELDHQASRAEKLLFGQAVETCRAAAATAGSWRTRSRSSRSRRTGSVASRETG